MLLYLVYGLPLLFWLFYKWYTWNFSYWKDKGYPYLEPSIPFGNISSYSRFDRYQGYVLQDIYNEMEDKPYMGLIIVRRRYLMVKDLEIIKCVMQKDFIHFTDRINVDNITPKDPLSEHLFNLGGEKWKGFRVKLTPTFSSGKMKLMFHLFEMCSKGLENLLDARVKDGIPTDVKDVMARYTLDIIGTCAFGLDINSIDNPDSEFRQVAKLFFPTEVPLKRKIINFVNHIFPKLDQFFRLSFFPKKIADFMFTVVGDTIKHRESTNFKRNDFIDLLMEIRSKGTVSASGSIIGDSEAKSIEIGDKDLASQVFVFFAAGFETSSSVSSYCLYELALDQSIQNKLRKEILEVSQKHGGITYAALQEMEYLEQVINETMRKYPTIPVLTRKCTKPYTMPGKPNLVLEKDVRVLIPVYAIHHDPKYYPDPEKFDPDRFSSENKGKIPQFAFLPFGEGPRICIGLRFGMLQTKMGIATIISRYRIEACSETKVPMNLVASTLITNVKDPIKLVIKSVSS